MKYITALFVLLFCYSAQADFGVWDRYVGHSGWNCDYPSSTYDSESEKDAAVAGGLKSWYGYNTAINGKRGPCVNENQPLGTFFEQSETCDGTCVIGDDGSIIAFAMGELYDKYGCTGPSCQLTADDTYKVHVYHNDYQACRRYHYTVSFLTAKEYIWAHRELPIFQTYAIIHGGENDRCWEILYGCGGGEDW